MVLLNVGEDPWLLEHESCEKLYRDIMEQLTLRQRQLRSSEKFAQLSASVRLRLKQYNNEVSQLNTKLEDATGSEMITAGESERRRRQVEMLQSKGLQMLKMFDEQLTNKATADRSSLIQSTSTSSPDDPQENFKNYSVDDLRTDQRKMLGDQEVGLENLHQIISRQKNIAQTIANEVDFHNEILDDLDIHMDRTDTRVRSETQHISVVDKKDKTCIYWVCIILLFISIIVVAVI